MKKILVIGATGLLGKPVATCLLREGYPVRLMVRDVEKAGEIFGDGFEIIQGDLTDTESLKKSLDGCFGVHLNLSGEMEQVGVENVSQVASSLDLQRISYISGTSVAEENTWVPVIQRKFFAEKAIRTSGVPYCIFCPTWFMEVLPKYVRGNRAVVFGNQPNPYHLLAADDYAGMVVKSYELAEAENKRFILHGPEGILFHDAVKQYCDAFHQEINKVSTMPYWLASIISKMKGRPEMKEVSRFMGAFEKIGELGDPSEANRILGAPGTTLKDWLQKRSRQ